MSKPVHLVLSDRDIHASAVSLSEHFGMVTPHDLRDLLQASDKEVL